MISPNLSRSKVLATIGTRKVILLALASIACAAPTIAQNAGPQPAARPPARPSASSSSTWAPSNADEVVVGFSNNTPRAPVITNPLWNGPDKPPTQASSGSRVAPVPLHKRSLASPAPVRQSSRFHPAHPQKDLPPPRAKRTPP